jgi:hypothetical protein
MVNLRVEIFFHIDQRQSCYSEVGMDLQHLQLILAVEYFSIGQVVKKIKGTNRSQATKRRICYLLR